MRASFDPAKNLNLFFRKGRNGSKVFTFLTPDDQLYELTDEFEFRSAFNVGLSVEDNRMTLEFDESQTVKRDSCFWEIINVTTMRTWLCGTAFFTDTLSAEVDDVEEITIALNGEQVTIIINEAGSSGVNGGTP